MWRGPAPVAAALVGTLKPMDFLPGYVTDAAWSPDGRYMAVSAVAPGETKPHIYVRDVRDDKPPLRLTGGGYPRDAPGVVARWA